MKKCVRGKYKEGEKLELPNGANPINFNGPRDVFCRYHDVCLEYLLQKNQYSRFFSCIKCPKASEFIRAQGSNSNIRRVAPKRTNANTLKGKRQSQDIPMGYKVIQQKNYGREL